MKIDAYTKVILTLIATSLIVLVVRSFQNPPAVLAQQQPQHVIIDGLSANGSFVSIGFDGLPVHEAGIKSFPGEPVVIKGVDLVRFIGQPEHGIPVYIVNPTPPLPVGKPK